jgi:hypothetical protein
MGKFSMTVQFDKLDHSPTHHRAAVATALDHVKLAVGRGVDTEGEITTPAVGSVREAVIGSWTIED